MKVNFNNLIPDKDLAMELTGVYMRVMTSGQYIGGKEVEAFEQEWAEYCQAKYCVSCGSGQSALELLLKAYNVGYGDEVIVPAWTAMPTWKAVMNVGAKPYLVDVNYDTMLMEIDTNYLSTISQHIKAIMPVYLYGYRAKSDYETWSNIPIINDACQAHGLKNLGNAAWSFYPTKNLGAYGDGGAITTDYEEIADTIRAIRNITRLDPLQAAFLRVKLGHLDENNHIRLSNAVHYDYLLRDNISINRPSLIGLSDDNTSCTAHQYVIRIKERDQLKSYLLEKGIETMIHYTLPLTDGRFPNADRLSQEVLSLPIVCSQEKVEYVCETINSYYERG